MIFYLFLNYNLIFLYYFMKIIVLNIDSLLYTLYIYIYINIDSLSGINLIKNLKMRFLNNLVQKLSVILDFFIKDL